jgi:hypothetical protein
MRPRLIRWRDPNTGESGVIEFRPPMPLADLVVSTLMYLCPDFEFATEDD